MNYDDEIRRFERIEKETMIIKSDQQAINSYKPIEKFGLAIQSLSELAREEYKVDYDKSVLLAILWYYLRHYTEDINSRDYLKPLFHKCTVFWEAIQ